jgi:hypothetical protein
MVSLATPVYAWFLLALIYPRLVDLFPMQRPAA